MKILDKFGRFENGGHDGGKRPGITDIANPAFFRKMDIMPVGNEQVISLEDIPEANGLLNSIECVAEIQLSVKFCNVP